MKPTNYKYIKCEDKAWHIDAHTKQVYQSVIFYRMKITLNRFVLLELFMRFVCCSVSMPFWVSIFHFIIIFLLLLKIYCHGMEKCSFSRHIYLYFFVRKEALLCSLFSRILLWILINIYELFGDRDDSRNCVLGRKQILTSKKVKHIRLFLDKGNTTINWIQMKSVIIFC